VNRTDHTAQIGLVSVADGALHVLKSIDWRGPSMLVFSPDGKYLAYDAVLDKEQRDIFVIAVDGSREIPAVVGPSQDIVMAWSNDGKRLLFASDRSGSVGLWSIPFSDGKVDGPPQLLRRDVGQVSSLGFSDTGKLYARVGKFSTTGDIHIATVDFAAGKLLSPPSLAAQTYVGNNHAPAWSPDGRYLAYASKRGSVGPDYFVIAIRSMETGEVREVSLSPGMDIVHSLIWALDGSLVVNGGDTSGHRGLLRVDARTGRTSNLVTQEDGEQLRGFASISADGKKLYYTKRNWNLFYARPVEKSLALIEKDLTTGIQKELFRTFNGLQSPDGQYVSILGSPSKATSLNVQSISQGELRELASDVVGQQQFRGMGWAADSSAIYVMKAPGEIWCYPIDGSSLRKVDLKLGNLNPGFFSVHPDGRRIAFEARPAQQPTEVWVLENLLPASAPSK
jgi:Tol biopolymer transport system component